MGFRIKVVERAGTAIKDLFSPTNIWRGEHAPDWTARHVPRGGKTSQTVQGETSPMRSFVPNANLGH